MSWRLGLRVALAVFFVLAGANHFRASRAYLAIMPPWLPGPRVLVYLSGALEIVGGLGVLHPRTRIAAGILLIGLLLAVLPANLHMALHDVQPRGWTLPRWALWARLPFQLVFIAWVWYATDLGSLPGGDG